jgi:hypothetical protein
MRAMGLFFTSFGRIVAVNLTAPIPARPSPVVLMLPKMTIPSALPLNVCMTNKISHTSRPQRTAPNFTGQHDAGIRYK